MKSLSVLIAFGFSLFAASCLAAVAGKSGGDDLAIVGDGKASGAVVVSPTAGDWEKRAAADLVHYVKLITGADFPLADTAEKAAVARASESPAIFVGEAALAEKPALKQVLADVAKKNSVLRADAIILKREGNRVYLAGTNDDCHYYAVAELLWQWGCRFYLPTEFGECIPEERTLQIGTLDFAYAPPFEVRKYWISWVGDTTGQTEFTRRNMMNYIGVPNGHILATYTKDLAPPGKSHWNVPIADEKTARHVAEQVAPIYAKGQHVQLGIEDGLYESDSPVDKELIALQYDKYFMRQSVTDPFMVFYNRVAEILMEKHPTSQAKIGFLAYANLTIPPVKEIIARPPLVAYLAPIDIDPIHHMDDPRSQPRREYKEMLYKWAKVMQGRLVIYDYDQGMLVWRDIPCPSLAMIRKDIHHYRKAGILGIDTESRNAIGTTFLNLFFRARLMWNPDVDVDALLSEFYPKFYGPAAEPMQRYWSAIYKAWDDTIVTEHEYFLVPAIYTPQLVETLHKELRAAETAVQPLAAKTSRTRNEQLVLDRMRFTRLSFDILDAYTSMIRAAWTEADYATAVKAGEKGLTTRDQMTEMNGTFTTYQKIGESGAAWWPGEVQQYRNLAQLIDGTKGTLVTRLPLEWAFRRDPKDLGVKETWAKTAVDLSHWNSLPDKGSLASRQNNSGPNNSNHWEMLRTDLYMQAQGVLERGVIETDFASYTGHAWYRTDVELSAEQAQGKLRLMFPGLFNECWLYVNGEQVAHREKYNPIWWYSGYEFEWDIDVAGKLKPGKNTIALRLHNPHHFGGMFRRPFLYAVK